MVAVAAGNKTNTVAGIIINVEAGILVADAAAVANLGSTAAILVAVLATEEILKIDLTIFNNLNYTLNNFEKFSNNLNLDF